MSLEIVTFPHPALKEVAKPIACFDEALVELVAEMTTLMHAHDGVGLAATQVGISRQLLLLSSYAFLSPDERAKVSKDPEWEGEVYVVINPEVLSQSEEEEIDLEGCLSFPEVYIKVSRPIRVKIKAFNLSGEQIELEGEGFGARAILHEMDHLNGKVMTDRISYLARQSALNKHRRIQKMKIAQQSEEEDQHAQSHAPSRVQRTHGGKRKEGKKSSKGKKKKS